MNGRDASAGARLLGSAREVVLIVAGILIAFGLDAWWDERQEQREIRESLVAVLGDLEASRVELDTVERANALYKNTVRRALSLTADELATLTDAEAASVAEALGGGALTFDPVVGSLTAMISGDRLYQLENAELRTALAAWPAMMDEIGEDQDIFIQRYMAQRDRAVELGLLERGIGAEPLSSGAQSRWELETALNDRLMRNRMASHAGAVNGLDEELADLGVQLDALIRLLEDELQ